MARCIWCDVLCGSPLTSWAAGGGVGLGGGRRLQASRHSNYTAAILVRHTTQSGLFINIDSGYVISPDSQQDNLGLGVQHVTGSVEEKKTELRYLHPLEPGHSRPLIETSFVPSTDNYHSPPDTKERKTRNGQNVFLPRDTHHLLLSSGQT